MMKQMDKVGAAKALGSDYNEMVDLFNGLLELKRKK